MVSLMEFDNLTRLYSSRLPRAITTLVASDRARSSPHSFDAAAGSINSDRVTLTFCLPLRVFVSVCVRAAIDDDYYRITRCAVHDTIM